MTDEKELTSEQCAWGIASVVCGIITIISYLIDSLGGIFIFSISTITFLVMFFIAIDNNL